MATLEEDLPILQALDAVRVESAELRDEGLALVRDLRLPLPAEQRARALLSLGVASKSRSGLTNWDFKTPRPTELDLLFLSYRLQAIASEPGLTFCPALPRVLYLIVRELYTAAAPEWVIGGMRAATGGPVSAHATLEGARGLTLLASDFGETAAFCRRVEQVLAERIRVQALDLPKEWKNAELRRIDLSFFVDIHRLSRRLIVPFRLPANVIDVPKFLSRAPSEMASCLDEAERALSRVSGEKGEAAKWREKERPNGKRESLASKEYERMESAHTMALEMLNRATATAVAAAKAARARNWSKVASEFEHASQDIERILRPTRRYAENVLDRELSAAAAGHEWDPGELVCAAVIFGLTSGAWDDQRLLLATRTLSNAISGQGKYPVSRPFHYDDSGSFRIITFQVTRYLAGLFRRIDRAELGGILARRLLAQFKSAAVREGGKLKGWAHEDAALGKPDDWVTAEATLALAELNRALDRRINEGVYEHFSVRSRRSLTRGPSLGQLFYGDYGFEGAPPEISRDSLAITLEEARGHIHGFGRRGRPWPSSYSIVLYGPPGTGKTTLVEALATSSGVPLVEVTPSDIVMGGSDAIERRARAAFSALSLLTATVVLFDEFDPVVWRRDPNNSAQSVFAFLTPGMLPKLKELHRTAKRRRVVYVLITNMVGSLDDAALRSGRFDKHIGVFPPDPLSRLGRLTSVASGKRTKLKTPETARVREVVRECAGQGMEQLARPGWFSPSEGPIEPGSPLYYVKIGKLRAKLPSPERTVTSTPEVASKFGTREWQEWKWITTWDNETKGKAAIDVGPRTIESPPPPSDGK